MTPSSKFPKLKEDSDYLNGIGLTEVTPFGGIDIEGEIDRMRADIRSLNTAIAIRSVVVLGLVALIVYFITQLK